MTPAILSAILWPLCICGTVVICLLASFIWFPETCENLLKRLKKAGPGGVETFPPSTPEQPLGEPVKTPIKTHAEIMRQTQYQSIFIREKEILAKLEAYDSPEQKFEIATRALAISLINSAFDRINYYIFGSQLQLLVNLSASQMDHSVASAKQVFEAAKIAFPQFHEKRTFDQWIEFLVQSHLVTSNGEKFEITIGGEDFLKHLIDIKGANHRAG